ncbi:hypothetical protein OG559_19855 [Micromonospora sp. NBC_01405]
MPRRTYRLVFRLTRGQFDRLVGRPLDATGGGTGRWRAALS